MYGEVVDRRGKEALCESSSCVPSRYLKTLQGWSVMKSRFGMMGDEVLLCFVVSAQESSKESSRDISDVSDVTDESSHEELSDLGERSGI